MHYWLLDNPEIWDVLAVEVLEMYIVMSVKKPCGSIAVGVVCCNTADLTPRLHHDVFYWGINAVENLSRGGSCTMSLSTAYLQQPKYSCKL